MPSSPLNLRLRESFNGDRPLLLPGAANALAARIIEDTGFEAVYMTGAGLTNMNLGMPDLGLITLSELADHVAHTRDATGIPLVVDADTGFGNPINVGRTVRVLERSGANAIQIEDQTFPKRCGHFDDKAVIPAAEMVQKIHAALDARQDDGLLIIARTDARATHGLDEALDRAAAYHQAGADVTFVEGPETLEEIARISRSLPGPQIINMVYGGNTPLASLEQLASLKVAAVLYANAALQAAIQGMQAVLQHLHRHGSVAGVEPLLSPWEERQRLVGKPAFDALQEKYRSKPAAEPAD